MIGIKGVNVMSKLDPKPERKNPQHSWDYLNSLLQTNIKLYGHATIRHADYSMSKNEIIAEAEKQGYKVTDNGNNHLKFE